MGWKNGVLFPAWTRDFIFYTASKLALGLAQSPVQWVPGIFILV
jgi:hypothetical protein